jgi:hypothetical protein
MILYATKLFERCCVTHHIALLGLFVAILPLIIPLCEGTAWNGLGQFPFGPSFLPESYYGPLPVSQITAIPSVRFSKIEFAGAGQTLSHGTICLDFPDACLRCHSLSVFL